MGMFNRALSSIVKAVITQVADAAGIQIVQVQVSPFETRDNTPRVSEFGHASNPPLNSLAVLAFGNGDRSSAVIIGTEHPESRPRNLAPGESMLYSQRGQRVYLSDSGIVIDGAGLPVTIINTPKVRAETTLFECTGDVVDNCDTTGRSMAADRLIFDEHGHPVTGIQKGNDTVESNPPTQKE